MGGTCDFPKKNDIMDIMDIEKKNMTHLIPLSWFLWNMLSRIFVCSYWYWLVYDHHLTFQTFQVSVLAKEWYVFGELLCTPPKTNMEPENEPLEEEIPMKNHHF